MNQCTCGFPQAQGMTHRLGQPCILTDGKALLDRGEVASPGAQVVMDHLRQVAVAEGVPAPDLLAGLDLTTQDPQYLDVTQAEIVRRGQEMAQGYEERITRLGEVIKNLSVSRDKLVGLRTALDVSINEVEALAPAVSDPREKTNYQLIAKWLREAADAAQD